MKLIINGGVIDTNVTPVALVFKDDNERAAFLNNIQRMPAKPGVRLCCEMPDDMPNKKAYFDSVVAFVTSSDFQYPNGSTLP